MKLLNRVKLIKKANCMETYGDSGYLAYHGSKENINYITDNIIPNKIELMNENYTNFLLRQKAELLDCVINTINKNTCKVSRFLKESYGAQDLRLNSEEDVIFIKNVIDSGYCHNYSRLISFYNENPNRRDALNSLLVKSKEAQLGHVDWFVEDDGDMIWCGYTKDEDYVLPCEDLLEIAANDVFIDIEANEIKAFVEKNKGFAIRYKEVTMENVEAARSELSKYVPQLKLDNIKIAELLQSMLSSSDMERISKCSALFDKVEIIEKLIENLKEADDEELVYKVIEACEDGFIQSGKDLLLISNKIKYGERFKYKRDFAYIVSGIKAPAKTISDRQYAKLITIKSVVSKNFYRNLLEKENLRSKTLKVDADLYCKLAKVLELGQLNENQYNDVLNMLISSECDFSHLFNSDLGYKMTYAEFMEINKFNHEIDMSEIAKLKDLKPNDRLKKIKEIILIEEALDDDIFVFGKEPARRVLASYSIKEAMRKDNPLGFENLADYINYIMLSQKVEVNTIEDYRKLLLIKSFVGLHILEKMSIDEALMKCGCADNLMKAMQLSEEFKTEYSKEIIKFFSSEEFVLINAYLNNRKASQSQRDSIVLIAKALIAGKYNDLKFVEEDILKEAGAEISNEAFDIWRRTDEVSLGKYTVSDSSDFKYIMKMGEIPVKSCMHYANGAYSQCLLSNFDTTKKIVTIHKNGRYVGRAILRLTKMADADYTGSTGLSFLDVDTVNEEVAVTVDKKENLIVFLEKPYTTLDKNDFEEAYQMIIGMLKEKTEAMGAKLVASNFYTNYAKNGHKYDSARKYVYITKSKNGQQYLDSFDGSTSDSCCYKSGNVLIY